MNAGRHAALYRLLDEMCDETLTAEGVAQLDALLRDDADARWEYLSYLQLHGALGLGGAMRELPAEATLARRAAELVGELNPSASFPLAKPAVPVLARLTGVTAALNRLSVFSVVTAAALVFALVTILGLIPRRPAERSAPPVRATQVGPVVAQVTATQGCVWGKTATPLTFGGLITPGQRIELKSGLLRLRFGRAAEVLLEGPATLLAERADRAVLERGQLVAWVAPAAVGFTIETREAKIIDLGTEFGVAADPQTGTEIRVFTGRVQVEPRQGDARYELAAGKAVRLEPRADSAPQTLVASQQRFTRALPRRGAKLVEVKPRHYALPNGSAGSYAYLDDIYDGEGDPTRPESPLRGGLGRLTDGETANLKLPWAPEPWLGWKIDPVMTFEFAEPVTIDAVVLHSYQRSHDGIKLPARVRLSADGGPPRTIDIAPRGEGAHLITLDQLELRALQVELALERADTWVFLDEIVFLGPREQPDSSAAPPRAADELQTP